MTREELIATAHEVACSCDTAHRDCPTCDHGGLLDLARFTIEELIKELGGAANGASVSKVCIDCKHYSAKQRYCPVEDAAMLPSSAKRGKPTDCKKWEAK